MHKNVTILVALVLSFLGIFFQTASAQDLTWLTSSQQALEQAKATGKIIFTHVTMDCGWDQMLEKYTFTNPGFKQLAPSFILLKADFDKEAELVQKFHVKACPTILFLNAEGNKVHEVKTYKTAAVLIPIMQKVLGVHADSTQLNVVWFNEIDKAFAAAKQDNKMVLVNMYTDGSGWSKKLDAETFSNPAFQKAAEPFVLLKVNMDKAPEFAKKYRVETIPSLLFLDADGAEHQRLEGFQPARALLRTMEKVLKR